MMVTKCVGSSFSNRKVKVEVLRKEFLQLQQDAQQLSHELQTSVTNPIARKSSNSNTDQYTQRQAPKYMNIQFFYGTMSKLKFIVFLFDLDKYFIFWKIYEGKKGTACI